MTELEPLQGDTSSAATAINDRGQVVGISGICDVAVGRFSAAHAVLWEDGEVIDIGNLGGVAWNTPMAINNHGEVVGFSNYSAEDEGAFNARAFYWSEETGIQDLGTLPGDAISQALSINDRGQVVGQSCTADFSTCRAFLWEDGVMLDLNALIGFGYDDHLYFANDINERGMITGQAVDAGSGDSVAFLAVPLPGEGGSNHDAGAAGAENPAQLLPAGARSLLLQRLGLEGVEVARP
jgi:probable HAF family extracellular repeat protein